MSSNTIAHQFPVTSEEYDMLEKKFGQLAHFEAWQLIKRNQNNNMIDSEEDIVQDLRMAMLTAGNYTKRQRYIETCFMALERRIDDTLVAEIFRQLKRLWNDRRRHGAGRQKFGPHQEQILQVLVDKYVPKDQVPDRKAPLVIDCKFSTYIKSITWNKQKYLGKKITREKSWRTGLVSLSEFDYLGTCG
jgi:hypothetical protein